MEETKPQTAPAVPEPIPSPLSEDLVKAKTFQEHKEIRQKGGARYRIQEKTRQAGEATRAAQEAAAAARTLVEEIKKKEQATTTPPTTTAPAVTGAQPAPPPTTPAATFSEARPKLADFQSADDYWEKLADWQIRKREFEKAQAAAPAPAAPAPAGQAAADPPEVAQLKLELTKTFDDFRARATDFKAKHGDFIDRMNDAAKRGLTLSPQNQHVLMSLENGPAVAYFLTDPANEAKAREIMNMSPMRGSIELSKISERLTVNPEAYVSNAPAPIPSLRGSNSRSELPLDSKDLSFQDYKMRRREMRRR